MIRRCSLAIVVSWGLISALAFADDAPTAPKLPPTDEHITRLIQQLGDGDFFLRERAQADLLALGYDAFDALTLAARNSDDIEVASRARYLVSKLSKVWLNDADPPEVKQLIADFDSVSDVKERSRRVDKLADLPPAVGLSALCRVVMFDKAASVSKRAAIRLIKPKTSDATAAPKLAETILATLGRSKQPAAHWLRIHLKAIEAPEAALAEWSALTSAEEQLLVKEPQASGSEIVLALLQRQSELLEVLKRPDEAFAVSLRMIALDQNGADSLNALIDKLIQQAAWDKVDQVAAKFSQRFESNPFMMYTLAQARRVQGRQKEADEIADRASRVDVENTTSHLELARALWQRGMIEWSEKEFRQVIKTAPVDHLDGLRSRDLLSRMLHDRGRALDAAQVLEEGLRTLSEQEKTAEKRGGGLNFGSIRADFTSRMHLFFAQGYGAKNDRAKQLEHLDAAIAIDPTEADALIELYKLSDATPERKAKTAELIRNAVDKGRKSLRESLAGGTQEGKAQAYNQLAWLLANTGGDAKEAVQLSKSSLEMRESSGYLDTLAHCHAAAGDFDAAVKTQTRALELDPHSGLLEQALQRFRKAQAEKKPK